MSLSKKIAGLGLMALTMLPFSASATSNITFTSDTTLSVGGVSLVIPSGSKVTSLVVGATTIAVVTGDGEGISFLSATKDNMTSSPTLTLICYESSSTLIVPSNTIATITVAGTACSDSAGGGSGGGSYASSGSPSSSSSTTVTAGALSITTKAKTTMKTDIGGAKKAYADGVGTPAFIDTVSIAVKSLPAKTKAVLALQATTAVKQIKLSKTAALNVPLTDDQEKQKLKLYYVDQNTGKPKYIVSRINKVKNLLTANVRLVGGVFVIVVKK